MSSGVAEVSSKYLTEITSNPTPLGYKKTEVGVIPEDWEIFSLGQSIAKTQLGGNYKNSEHDTGQPLIKMGNLGRGFVKLSKQEFVIGNASESDLLNYGDVLFNTRNTLELVGKVAIWKNELPKAYFNSNLMRISFKEDLVSSNIFMNALMNSEGFIKALSDIAIGTTSVAAIYNRDLFLIKVALPTKKEQTAIANALSDVDALISELEKLIAKKQAIKTATMQQLLTGRTRLPQFALRDDGTPKGTKSSELGEIPEDWEVVAMGDLGSTYGGLSGKSKQDFGHGNSLYVPFTNVMANVVVDVDNLEKVDVREAQNNLALGDLLFNGSSETPEEVCFSALVSADIRKLYLNSFCFGFRSNQKNAYLPLYLAYWFRSEVGRAAVLVMAQGSTRYNISKSQFMKLTIVLPDTEEQTAIATILSDIDAEIQALEQRLGKTRQIKQGMMQELLTGKTRLVQPSLTGVCHAD